MGKNKKSMRSKPVARFERSVVRFLKSLRVDAGCNRRWDAVIVALMLGVPPVMDFVGVGSGGAKLAHDEIINA
jgi:hypothetical protein